MPYLKVHQKPRVYLDVETTGLDPHLHEIIEFAALKDDGSIHETKIKPEHIERAHPKALEANGYTAEEWADAPTLEEVAPAFYEFIKDCIVVGHNVRFDASFIEASLRKAQIQERIDFHVVDTVTLAYEHLAPLGLKSLSLWKVCVFLGIPPEPDVHRAMNGAIRARQVYHALARAGWWRRLIWRMKRK